ncbi:MAG TPA: hypothetical protein VJB66_05680 [Candidatus Nanoarchaeia archaeon]|nr:hypothetical protein [Candidatus Nanoarchaeia archaeon]
MQEETHHQAGEYITTKNKIVQHSLTIAQKILFGILIALIVLMIIFSIRAIKDKGIEGYNACVQKKCDEKGTDFCEKTREKNNCCMGAGGQLAQNEQGLTCRFE